MENVYVYKTLPSIALRGLVPLPNNDIRTEVGRKVSIAALDEAEKNYDGKVVLLVQKDASIEAPKANDIENVGALAEIAMKIKLPNGNFKVKFKVIKRVNLIDIDINKECFYVDYEEMEDNNINQTEEDVLVKMVVNSVMNATQGIIPNQPDLIKSIQQGVSNEKLADLVSNNLKGEELNKLKYLKEASLNKRLEMILEDIEKEKSIIDIENKINAEVKKSIDESQKEYYLREKMKAIQTELGDKAKRDDEIEELRKKIQESGMPKEIEEKALDELSRYQQTPSVVAESGIIKSYLDFLVALPWKEESKDNDNIKDVSNKLEEKHFSLNKVKERIIEYLAVKILTGRNPQTILCLVGPPGVGKTTLAMSIANALNRKFVAVKLGGVKDESEIRGHRRTYIGAMPGRILTGMKKAGTINPVFLLDEIDKMTSDLRGDPASALLEVLDPEQNAKFSDHYLEEYYDLSNVLFITTANYIENIPAPLRDRMEIIHVSSYTEYEKFNIAKLHLVKKSLENNGLDESKFEITDEAIYNVIRHYTREAGVRELSRMIDSIVRKSVKSILMDGVESVKVDEKDVPNYLGKIKYQHNVTELNDKIGVVNGLAYTEFGGDTLSIEVSYFKGKGGLILTGKLGDVMKESAQTAIGFIKSHASKFNIDPKIFDENDIHIHVPEGAVPKDGPSAGVTMTTAIVSALSNRMVRADLGMTGEITLTGNVLPIGGLKEKSIAAVRSGLKTILIPRENERDIDEIPQEVKDVLEIIPVNGIDEVIKNALR